MNARSALLAILFLSFSVPALADDAPLHPPFMLGPLVPFSSRSDPVIGNEGPDCPKGQDLQIGILPAMDNMSPPVPARPVTIRIPSICPGYRQFFANSIAMMVPRLDAMFLSIMPFERIMIGGGTTYERYFPAPTGQPKLTSPPKPSADLGASFKAPADAGANELSTYSTGSDHGSICPELANPPTDGKANDPKTVCSCTKAYLRHIADQAIALYKANPNVDFYGTKPDDSLRRIVWAAGLAQTEKPPGWLWRCDILEHPPEKKAEEPLPNPPEKPVKGFLESREEYAAKMKAYGDQYREYIKNTMGKRQGELREKMDDTIYAANIAVIPELSYASIMIVLASWWNMEEIVDSYEAANIEGGFLDNADKETYALWTQWAASLKSVTLGPDHSLNLSSVASAMQPQCTAYDKAVNGAISPTADKMRQLAKGVKDQHDQMMKEIKMWGAFSARDGFPRSGKGDLLEAHGGFLGLEPIFFKNENSLALHPGFGTQLRSTDGFSYMGISSSPMVGVGNEGDQIWKASTDCRILHIDTVPAGFAMSVGQQVFAGDSEGNAAAAAALKGGALGTQIFWIDVLKAGDDLNFYASGADASEVP